MCDVYIYYFNSSNGPRGKNVLSTRPATLEAIKGRGEPVMESQIVVDHTELDTDGFLAATIGSDSHAIGDIAAQIWSLEVRAASRDNEALISKNGIEQYMLGLESRELRKQAGVLKSRRTEITAGELSSCTDTTDFVQFEADLATGQNRSGF
jgi:hypothetical protein